MTPEGEIKAYVKRRLDAEFDSRPPFAHYRFMPVQTGYGKRSLDFLLCIYGKFYAIETKAPGKDLTELQKITRDEIQAAGGTVYKVDSYESCDAAIEDIKWRS